MQGLDRGAEVLRCCPAKPAEGRARAGVSVSRLLLAGGPTLGSALVPVTGAWE